MLISIAIPCYNSAKTLPKVVKEIKETFATTSKHDYQIILVNDNSPDNTFEVISELCNSDQKIIGVDLSKNYGQASAQMAAIQYIKGDIAVFMDDDGQHPPKEIFKLVDKIQDGYDLVYACFMHKKHSLFKRITSALNAKILEALKSKPKGIRITSYFAISKFSINALRKYHSPFPSIESYLLQTTNRFSNVVVTHRERLEGTSNYNLKKLLKLWLQGLTNFSIAPLRFASFIGVFAATTGFITGLVLIIQKIIFPDIALGYTSTMAAIVLIGGLVMSMLGMLGEYIGRIYILLSGMPQYQVRVEINSNHESENE